MKNKTLLFSISLIILLLPISVLGAYSYDRTPTGYEITSPVSFEIDFDSYADMDFEATSTHWGIILNLDFCGAECPDSIFSYCLPVSTLSHTFVIDVPLDYGVDDIYLVGDVSEELCESDPTYAGVYFEESAGFTIVPPPPPVPPITAGFEGNMPESSIASTTAFIGDLFSSTGVLIYLFIGIPFGFFIIIETIGMIKDRLELKKNKQK